MDAVIHFFTYVASHWANLLTLTYGHILMVLTGIMLALIVGIPLGILCAKNKHLATIILGVANVIQVFPSLALLAVLMILLGIGFNTIVVGLFLYSLLPIIRNTYVGLQQVDPSATQAGKGMGMTSFQLLTKIQFPLSLPFMVAGLRLAAVIAIGVATLAPYFGGEGLGREIVSGINLRNPVQIYSGAIIAAILAIIADFLLGRAQKRIEYR